MAELRTEWPYPLLGASGSRKAPRTATPPNMAFRVVGVDGNDEGGLKPSTGFRQVVDLDYGYGDEDALTLDGGYLAGGEMTAFFPVTFRISDTKYAHGFVYEVVNRTLNKAVYRLKFKIGGEATWRTCYSMGFGKGLLGGSADYADEQFHVQVFGRFVYCFRSSKQPFVFYVDEPTLGTYNLIVRESTGGGVAPLMTNPTLNSVSAITTADTVARPANMDLDAVLTDMTAPAVAEAEARVIYFGFSNIQKVTDGGAVDHNSPFLLVRNPPLSTGVTDLPINGPSDIGLWATPPQPDPTFQDFLPFINNVPATPVYPTPATYGEYNGAMWSDGVRPDDQPYGFLKTGTPFVWAYRLYDSRTGLYSPLSNRMSSTDDGYGASAFFVRNSGTTTSWQGVTFPMVQIIYNNTKYDTMLLYRGRNQAALTLDDIVLSLERAITLADFHIDTQPVDTAWSVAAYFPTLSEPELSQQEVYDGLDTFSTEMPHAGSALFYEATMLMGKMGEIDDEVGGLGKFVWSSLSDVSVELVSPSSRYVLQTPDEEIERFLRLGPNAVGLSRLSQYFIRREYDYLKAMPLHIGFGVVNARAAAEVGSNVYFMSQTGLQVLTPDGGLSDVGAIDNLVQNEWVDDLSDVEMAYDAAAGVLFVLNPNKDSMACLWLRKGRLTEFEDIPFEHVTEGDALGMDNRLHRQAIFVHQETIGTPAYRWRVYVYDYSKSKSGFTLLQPAAGDRVFTNAVPLLPGTTSIVIDSGTFPLDIGGCYLYWLDGADAGARVKIVRRVSGTQVETEALPVGIGKGGYLGLSPVLVEWVGPQVGMKSADGFMFSGMDFHAAKHVDGVVGVFSNVSIGSGVPTTLARYQGFVYVGDAEDEADKKFPEGTAREAVRSIEDGPSRYNVAFGNPTTESTGGRYGVHGWALHPGVRIFVPDIDYRLLSVKAFGNIRDDDAIRSRSVP